MANSVESAPQVVGNFGEVDQEAAGSVWKLSAADRDLDANIISLPAGDSIASHIGPDIGVLIHVLSGSGSLVTAVGAVPLRLGDIVWLPARSQREFLAGPTGLKYFSVHQRKPGLSIGSAPER